MFHSRVSSIVLCFIVMRMCSPGMAYPAAGAGEQEIIQEFIGILANLESIIDANLQSGAMPDQGYSVQSLNESRMTIRGILANANQIRVNGYESLTGQDLYWLKMLSVHARIARELTDWKNTLVAESAADQSVLQVGPKRISPGPVRLSPFASGDDLPPSDAEFPMANYNQTVLGDPGSSGVIQSASDITTVLDTFLAAASGYISTLPFFGDLGDLNPFDLMVDFVQNLTYGIQVGSERGEITPLYLDFFLAAIYGELADICNNLTASLSISFGVSLIGEVDVGINLNFICIVGKTLANVHQFSFAKRSFIDGDIDSAEIEGAYDRLEYLHRQLKDVNNQILNSNMDLETNIKNHIDQAATQLSSEISNSKTAIIERIDTAETNLTSEINENQTEINENETKIDQAQWTLDNVSAKMDIHLQVLELKNKAEYLIAADEAGTPIDLDIPFLAVKVAADAGTFAVTALDPAQDAEVKSLGGGLHHLKIKLPKGVTNANILILHVKHSHDGFAHWGFAMTPVSGMK